MSMAALSNIQRLQELVAECARVHPIGGGSKAALSRDANLDLKELSGVLEYEPAEYTFTALAGTPVAEVQKLLAANGQYLPFDPPLATAGATLGGTVAAGVSGPGRFRYGGVRDFLLGVRFINGEGELVTGGAKVVKNAAGFDLPKLMVGALGRFGLLVELTFKVFPRPEAYVTLVADLPDTDAALEVMKRLATSPFELACLDFTPPARLWLRLGGIAEVLPRRVERLQGFIGRSVEVLEGEADESAWDQARAFGWRPARHDLVKLPLTPGQIPRLERALLALESAAPHSTVPRRYSVGGHLAWLAWPETKPAELLESIVNELNRPALALTGNWANPQLGRQSGQELSRRLLSVLDPGGKFRLDPSP
jgi:glycolate oxidase FAD binding subunit